MSDFTYDTIGKVDMSGIYNNADPTRYFTTLEKLGYRIPQEGKPLFQRLMAARRAATGERALKLLDLGCSYGVNAALLKHGVTMDELYRHYGELDVEGREEMIREDRAFLGELVDDALSIVGLDPAEKAIGYAVDVGALDAGIASDLEKGDPSADELAAIQDADLVISTGCYGYVTDASLGRILEAAADSRPWMAHFVLRMFDFGEAEEMLDRHGYVTEKVNGLFPQRRFATAEERDHALDNLAARGIDPSGAEDDGWYFAELFVARPREHAEALPVAQVLGRTH